MPTLPEETGNQQGTQPFRRRDPFADLNQRISGGIDAFGNQLDTTNKQFFDIGQSLIDRGQGIGTDPLVEAQRGRAMDAQRASLVRSGVTGGVFQNQQNRLSSQFDQSNLARRDQALQGGLQLQQSALQNLLAEPTLNTAQLTANKAGGGGGGGKK